jgi:hypothetical protein
MNPALLHDESAVAATLLDGARSLLALERGLERAPMGLRLEMRFPDFNREFKARVLEIEPRRDEGKVVVRSEIVPGASLVLILEGDFVEDSGQFVVKYTWLDLERSNDSSLVDYLAGSLWAMIALSGEILIHVPDLELYLPMSLELPLQWVSTVLQRRQIAFQALCVERATGVSIPLPADIPQRDREVVEIAYRAVTERSFSWPMNVVREPVPVTPEELRALISAPGKHAVTFRLEKGELTLFGRPVRLGPMEITIENAALVDAQVDFGLLSGKVPSSFARIRSLSGRARYTFPAAPLCPGWDDDPLVAVCATLDGELTSRLARRYHDAAAASLSSLSEEEKAAVTARIDYEESGLIRPERRGDEP